MTRQRSPNQPIGKRVHSYPPNQLSTDLTCRASETHCTSHLENDISKQQENPSLNKNRVSLKEDGEILPAASARLPAKDVVEISAIGSSGGMNVTSHHRAMYCFGMVYGPAPNFNVGEVNRLSDCWKLCVIFRVKKCLEPTVSHRQQSYATVSIQK